jgi:hypothetical protein
MECEFVSSIVVVVNLPYVNHIYICIYVYMYTYLYLYIYIYISYIRFWSSVLKVSQFRAILTMYSYGCTYTLTISNII